MPRLPSSTPLVLLLLFPAFLCAPVLSHGQASGSAPIENSAEATSSKSTPADQTAEASPVPANAPQISRQSRLEIIRDFETQMVYARSVFPMGLKGLQLREGVITPNGEALRQALAIWGPAVKPGDPARISFVQIKGDHIHFELNGGPLRHKKWYQRIELSGANGTGVAAPDNPQTNAHGSYVDLYFGKYVPEMTPQQLRDLLYPVLDFKARNREQAYLDTVPPKVKEAIQTHHVLVGMNQEMVVHAKGRPPKKVREREGETEYEEWIYGEPPADVDFVRLVGDEVVRVETMRVGGEKIVRTEKEVVLEQPEKEKEAKEQEERPANPPSLRRPGEDSSDVPKPANGDPKTLPTPPNFPDPGGGPGEMVSSL